MTAKLTIGDMQAIAKERGGKCLSKEYINNHTKLSWQCKKGHVWGAIPNSIKLGHWCPECALEVIGNKKRLHTIEEMREIAKSRGGRCLSKRYVNTKNQLKWQCKKGHVWWSRPNDIQSGYWCPHCAGSMKHSIEEMRDMAKKKGGKCLSKRYVNNKTKLKWQCSKGHIFKKRYNDIQSQGQWCPYCV